MARDGRFRFDRPGSPLHGYSTRLACMRRFVRVGGSIDDRPDPLLAERESRLVLESAA
jgi:hypothetical protein